MAITCALDNEKLSALYKVIYADLKKALNNVPEGQTLNFDLDVYMNSLFSDLVESSDEDAVLNFMQMVPAMTGQILMTVPGFEEVGDLGYIRKKSNQFRNDETGYKAMRDFFSLDVSKEELARIVSDNKATEHIPPAVTNPDALKEGLEDRAKPSSALTSTFQEFKEKKPDEVVDEEVDPDKVRIYTVIDRIQELSKGGVTDVEYPTKDGGTKILKLKTLVLDKIPKAQQTEKTKEYIKIYNKITQEGTRKNKEQLGPKEIVALVVMDEKGNYVFFDDEGNITNEKQGKLVYQLLRSARKDGNKYTVKDLYNIEDQIQTPEEIVMNRYKYEDEQPSAEQLRKEIQEETVLQQSQFKALYDLRQSVINGKTELLSITGTSVGMLNKKVPGNPEEGSQLKDILSEFTKAEKKSALNSITIYDERYEDENGTFYPGQSSIIIGNKTLKIDRPTLNEALARRVAAALTSETLSVKEKRSLFDQFFPKEAKLGNFGNKFMLIDDVEGNLILQYNEYSQREVAYNLQKQLRDSGYYKGELNGYFKDFNKEYEAALAKWIKDSNIKNLGDLQKKSSLNLSSPGAQEQLASMLLSANIEIDKNTEVLTRTPARFIVNKRNLLNDIYLDFDLNKNKLVEKNYSNFLLSDDVNLKLYASEVSLYNRYINFTLPSKVNDQAAKAQESIKVEEILTDVPVQQDVEKELEEPVVDNSTKDQTTSQLKSTVAEQNADPQKASPSTTKGIAGLFNLDRSMKLPQGVTQSQLDAAEKWWKNSPLQKYINYEHQSNIVNSDAFARFVFAGRDLLSEGKAGTVILYGNGNFVDLYHESWHVFSQLFLTKEQKIKLYNEVIDTIPQFKKLKGVDSLETYKEIEEYLAEEFRKYAKNPKAKKNAPVRNSLFRRMLNYLKALFGKLFNRMDVTQDVLEIDTVKEMFDNLYMSSEDPSVLNKYLKNLNIDQDQGINRNALFDGHLNRGIKQVSNKKEDALNRQDSNSITQAIDSLYSEIVDEVVSERKLSTDVNTKSAVLRLFNDPKNREVAYGIIKQRLQDRLDQLRSELGPISSIDFNSLKTLGDLRQNAVATIISNKGDNKYIFLRSQIEDFENLNADTKDGLREKGKIYYGIRIVGDYYSHKTIKDKTKDFADIIIVDDLQQARAQFNNYLNRIGGERNVNIRNYETNVEAFQNANRPLTGEEEALLDNIRVLQTALNNWGDQKSGTVKYHRENSTFDITKQAYKEAIPGVEESEDEVEANKDQEELEDEERKTEAEEAAADKIYGQPTNIKSLQDLADSEVIYVLKSLFKVEGGKYVTDRFGFKQLASFKHTWNTIASILENVKDPQEMYNRLREASLDYPEIYQLITNKLPNPSVENSEVEYDLTTSFWKTFNKHRVRYIQLYAVRAGDKYLTEVINASIDISNVKRLFQSKFRAETDSKYITRQKNVTRLNLDRIVKDFKRSKSFDTYNFLKAIGFYFDEEQDRDNSPIKRDLKGYKNYSYYGIPYILDIVEGVQKLSKQQNLNKSQLDFIEAFRTEPLQTLIDGVPPKMLKGIESGTSQKTQVERIMSLEIKHGAVGSTYSVLNPEGNKVQEHTLNNGATYLITDLNKAQSLSDLWVGYDPVRNPETSKSISNGTFLNPTNNSWTLRSQIIKTLFNLTDEDFSRREGKTLEYMMVSGTQIARHRLRDTVARQGQTTSNMDEYGKVLQELHTMLKSGVQEFMRPGSKSASYGVKLNGGFVSSRDRNNPNLYVDIEDFIPGSIGETRAIKEIVIPYIAAEVERIRRYQETPEAKDYIGFNKPFKSVEGDVKPAGESFVYFDTSLRTETKNKILNAVKTSSDRLEDYLEENPSLETEIIADISEYFEELTEQLYSDVLSKVDFIDPTLMDVLEETDLSEEDKKKVLLKAYNYNGWIHNVEMTILFNGDIAQQDHDKEGLHKRTSGLPSNGEGFRIDRAAKDFINKVLHKKNTYAKVRGYGDFHYDGTFTTAVMDDVVRVSRYVDEIEAGLREDYERRYASQLKSNPARTKAIIDERVAVDLEPYTEMEEADGAGYITVDAYRTLKKLQGSWSQAQEDLYQLVIEGKEISSQDIIKMFPVYKLQHYGHLMGTKLPVTAMHKFALTPIIPTVFKNADLNRMQDEMMRQGAQYVLFSSGSKVGSVGSNGTYDQVYESDKSSPLYQKSLKENFTLTPNVIHLANLKEASQVSDKLKGQVVFMTQLRKMIEDGLMDAGVYRNSRFKKYLDNYDALIEEHRNLIEDEIKLEYGIAKTKDGSYKIDNINKFVNLIHRELERKNIPDHLISRINANRNGNFRVDPSIHIEAETVESLIFNISKKLIKQKMKGEALVQVPSTMTNGMMTGLPDGVSADMPKTKADYDKLYKKYLGTNTLPFYRKGQGKNGNTASAGIAIALQGDFKKLLNFKHNDGDVIGTIDRLNDMIKNDKWLDTGNNRQAVTVVGVRIPTQQKSFMESYEVFQFLPEEAGSLILMPSEAVAKSGSDYDVDKVTLFMPSLSEEGVTNAPSLSDEQFNSLSPSEQIDYLAKRKATNQNNIIAAVQEILLDKDFYAELVRPTGTNILKPLSELNQEILSNTQYNRKANFLGHGERSHTKKSNLKVISPSVTLTPRYNAYKSARNLVGKTVLGVFMNEIAINSIFNKANAKMPASWSKTNFSNETTVSNIPVRLLLSHNKDKEGRVMLSKLDTSDGLERISEVLSNGANGLVDIETDDWIFDLGVNEETAGVFLYLISAGVPMEEIRLFFMNPLIRRYGEVQRIKGGMFGFLSGVSPEQKSQVKRQSMIQTYAEGMGISLKKSAETFKKDAAYLPKGAINTGTISYVDKNGTFSIETLSSPVEAQNIKDPKAVAGFLHFLEIENYIKDLTALKRDSKPDNNIYNSLQQVEARDVRLNNLKETGNVDPNLVDAITEDSILRTFFDNQLVSDVVKDVMPLRNAEAVSKRIRELLSDPKYNKERALIKAKYTGFTGEQRFVKEYKNGVLDFIYQNFMSNLFSDNGVMVNIPASFRGKKVVKTKELFTKGIKLEDGVFYVNEDLINEDFAKKRYLALNANEDLSYLKRDLPHFREEDPFPTKSSFYKYLFEREYLRKVYDISDVVDSIDFKNILKEFKAAKDYSEREAHYKNRAYVELLSRHALVNVFNRNAILRQGAASYTQKVLDTVEMLKKLPGLKDRYPILEQIIPFTDVRGNYVITLNDQPILEGALAETYQQNIRELADPSIKKVKDPLENKRITDVFRMFAKALIYQHGVGKTKYGINQALPQEEFEMIMQAAVPTFVRQHLTENTQALDIVFDVLFDNKVTISEETGAERFPQAGTAFRDYTVDADVYNSGKVPVQEIPTITEDSKSDEVIVPVKSTEVLVQEPVEPEVPVVDKSAIPKGVTLIDVPSPLDDFMVSFTDETGKQQQVYVANDALDNPVIKLNNPPRNAKGYRPSRDQVDQFARKHLGDGLVDFMLGWKALLKEEQDIVEHKVLGIPVLDRKPGAGNPLYTKISLEEINKRYDTFSSEIKEGADKYLRPFAPEGLNKRILKWEEHQQLSLQRKVAPDEVSKEATKTVIEIYKKALSRFESTQPQAGVTSPSITTTTPTPTVTTPVDVTKQEGEFEFEFNNGFKIYTPFKLNSDQQMSLYFMEDFIKSPEDLNNMMALEGFAGTGKTTVMSLFIRKLRNDGHSIKLTSPTHRANTVTKKNNPEYDVITLAKAFGLKPTFDMSNSNSYDARDVKFGVHSEPLVKPGDTLIIDEASMVTEELFNMIEEVANELDVKVIFMGDPAQLDPVYGENDPRNGTISPVFQKTSKVKLNIVERTGDNPILATSTSVRLNGKLSFKSEEKDGKGVQYIGVKEHSAIQDLLKVKVKELVEGDNKFSFRILSYLNSVVDDFNKMARQMAFGEKANEPYIVGDILMGAANRGTDDNPGIKNSVDYTVEKVQKIKRTFTTINNKRIPVQVNRLTIKNLTTNEESVINVVDMGQDKSTILAMLHTLRQLGKSAKIEQSAGETFGPVAQKLAEVQVEFLFPETLSLNDKEAYPTEYYTKADKTKGILPAVLKSLSYGYAHTIHKSQGGTYNNVMVLGPTIYKLKSETTEQFSKRAQKLNYVAISRASDYVYYVQGNGSWNLPSAKSIVTTNIPDTVKPTKEGIMSFDFKGLQREDVMSDNTFDAILEGARTATTRYIEDASYEYWVNTKKGDVIRWWSKGKTGEGEYVDVEVTKDPQPIDWSQMDDQAIMEWSLKEGWDGYKMEQIKKQGTTRLKGIQIEFRKLETAEERAKKEQDESNDKDNFCSNI